MNPLGEPFEMFDDWGRYREVSYFDEDGKIYMRRDGQFDRLLKEGEVDNPQDRRHRRNCILGDPKVDGDVKDAVEMMQRLGRSDRARHKSLSDISSAISWGEMRCLVIQKH